MRVGRVGPGAADDKRVVCLPCSSKPSEKNLVRRQCPALKRRRYLAEVKEKVDAERARVMRGEAFARVCTVAGVDVRVVARKCWAALVPGLRAREAAVLLARDPESTAPHPRVRTDMPAVFVRRRGRVTCVLSVPGDSVNFTLHQVELQFASAWTLALWSLAILSARVGDPRAGEEQLRAAMSGASIALWDIGLPRGEDPFSFLLRALRKRWAQPTRLPRPVGSGEPGGLTGAPRLESHEFPLSSRQPVVGAHRGEDHQA